jgi:HTH-type transcriptional regulator/antitoxin HipB
MWAQSAVEVGRIIAAARRHRKLTQGELARAIGASQAWVSEVERGKDSAQIGKVLRTLAYLGVKLQTGVTPWAQGTPSKGGPAAPNISLESILESLAAPRGQGKR